MARIMVVDDEVEIAQLLREFLVSHGFEVVAISNSRDACQRLLSEVNVDLVVMDIKMPGMRGMEIAQCLRSQKKDIPIIFITGSISVVRYRQLLKEMDYSDSQVLEKPIDLQKILQAVKQHLPHSSSE